MIKDVLGNDLKAGDVVIIPKEMMGVNVVANVVSVQEGGIISPVTQKLPDGQIAITPGKIMLRIEVALSFNPQQPINIVKVSKPISAPELVQ